MAKISTKNIGDYGELIVERYLNKNNYLILAKNSRFSNLEIDFIFKDKHELVICEVKSTQSKNINPEDYIDKRKILNLRRSSLYISREYKTSFDNIRFDFIFTQTLNSQRNIQIKHYKDVI